MSEFLTGITRGGQTWTPKFVQSIDQKACIGCGRCYKVCSRGVLEMIGITEDGDIVDALDDEAEKKVMNIANMTTASVARRARRSAARTATPTARSRRRPDFAFY